MTITPARLEVLQRCAIGEGLRPIGPDWFAIYWLREHGYVVKTFHRAVTRYAPTPDGSALLLEANPNRNDR